MTVWIGTTLALAIHKLQIAEHGGEDGVRDIGMLESALARARNIAPYEPDADVARLAAAFAVGIIKDHPFVDGNKRTDYVVRETSLVLNGHQEIATEAEKYPIVIAVADGSMSEDEFGDWLRNHLDPA